VEVTIPSTHVEHGHHDPHMGKIALDQLGDWRTISSRGLHSMLDGKPEPPRTRALPAGQTSRHFVGGSNYRAGNVASLAQKSASSAAAGLLSRQKMKLRLPQHSMLIYGALSPHRRKNLPSLPPPSPAHAGKTNFAMLDPARFYKGWKITTVGDDIAWMWAGKEAALYAHIP